MQLKVESEKFNLVGHQMTNFRIQRWSAPLNHLLTQNSDPKICDCPMLEAWRSECLSLFLRELTYSLIFSDMKMNQLRTIIKLFVDYISLSLRIHAGCSYLDTSLTGLVTSVAILSADFLQ
jgi:hypothetical protein